MCRQAICCVLAGGLLAAAACGGSGEAGPPATVATVPADADDRAALAKQEGLELKQFDLNRDDRPDVFKFYKLEDDPRVTDHPHRSWPLRLADGHDLERHAASRDERERRWRLPEPGRERRRNGPATAGQRLPFDAALPGPEPEGAVGRRTHQIDVGPRRTKARMTT